LGDIFLKFFLFWIDRPEETSYKPHIDDGVALRNDRSRFFVFKAKIVTPMYRRADVAPSLFGLYGQLGPALCCLTIESEERETWTAEVLADRLSSEGQSMRYSDGHVF